jgi:hypothetical protein
MAQTGVPDALTILAHAQLGPLVAAVLCVDLHPTLDPAHEEVVCSQMFAPWVPPCHILWIRARRTAAPSIMEVEISGHLQVFRHEVLATMGTRNGGRRKKHTGRDDDRDAA